MLRWGAGGDGHVKRFQHGSMGSMFSQSRGYLVNWSTTRSIIWALLGSVCTAQNLPTGRKIENKVATF